jgi:hypothetical protein
MKRTPLLRKTPLASRKGFAAMSAIRHAQQAAKHEGKAAAMRTKLKQRRSTGRATKAQKARWADCRARGCVACHLNMVDHGMPRASYANDLEMHHLLSGGRRRGHDETICLCHYHHQGKRLPYPENGYDEHSKVFGPSLGREPRRFREFYGTDDELLAYQQVMLERAPVFGPEASW